jgi:hypothetical protein
MSEISASCDLQDLPTSPAYQVVVQATPMADVALLLMKISEKIVCNNKTERDPSESGAQQHATNNKWYLGSGVSEPSGGAELVTYLTLQVGSE